jgi:PEP-CTERM motif
LAESLPNRLAGRLHSRGHLGPAASAGPTDNCPSRKDTERSRQGREAANFVAVPEPSTWALMIAGVLVVAFQLRRRR